MRHARGGLSCPLSERYRRQDSCAKIKSIVSNLRRKSLLRGFDRHEEPSVPRDETIVTSH